MKFHCMVSKYHNVSNQNIIFPMFTSTKWSLCILVKGQRLHDLQLLFLKVNGEKYDLH